MSSSSSVWPVGRRVDHGKLLAPRHHRARERLKHRDLFVAGGLQFFLQQGQLLRRFRALRRLQHPRPIAPHFLLGIDVTDFEVRNALGQSFEQMLCRVGGGQVDGLAALGKRDRDGGGNRGLADAALSHDHDKAVLRGGRARQRAPADP